MHFNIDSKLAFTSLLTVMLLCCLCRGLHADLTNDPGSSTSTFDDVAPYTSVFNSLYSDGQIIYLPNAVHTYDGGYSTLQLDHSGNVVTINLGAQILSTGSYAVSNFNGANGNQIINSGTIQTTFVNGLGLWDNGTNTSILNNAQGVIEGVRAGIIIDNICTLENYGNINGTAAVATDRTPNNGFYGAAVNAETVNAAIDFTNHVSGAITGTTYGVNLKAAPTQFTNNGTITATNADGYGLYLLTGSNEAAPIINTGYINGGFTGGYGSGSGIGTDFSVGTTFIDNSGQIQGDFGIDLNNGGKITNRAGGKIIGQGGDATFAIYSAFGSDNTLDIDNSGQISGYNGIYLGSGGTITNYAGATITGTHSTAVQFSGFDVTSVLINQENASISSTSTNAHAVYAHNNGHVDNAGSIQSTNYGVSFNQNGNVINRETGTINADKYAVYFENDNGTVTNYGSISGGNSYTAIYRVNTLTNYGTIDAHFNSNRAIDGTSGNDTFTLFTGSTTIGGIMGNGGSDMLILDGDGTGTMNQWSTVGITNFTKQGTGTWIIPSGYSLNGASSFAADAGTLVINGSVTVHDGQVNDGATIQGTGSINAVNDASAINFNSGSTLATGNSIGHMTINTDLYLNAGATMQVELNTNSIDELTVNGTMHIAGDLHLLDLSGNNLVDGQQYDFINAEAYDGMFANITDNSAMMDFTASIDGQLMRLTAHQASNFEDHALPHQNGLARRLDLAMENNQLGDLTGALVGLDETSLRNEMDRLRPNGAPIRTVFSNAQGFSQDSLQLARSAQQGNTRFAAAPGQSMLKQLNDDPYSLAQDSEQATEQANISDGKLHFFASPFGQFGDIDSSDARTGYSYDAYGAIIGVDYNCIPNMSLGLSLGYINTDIGLDNSAGDSKVDTLRFGPYLTYTNGNWNVDASITGGFHWVDGKRNTIMGTAESDYNSYDFTIYGAASYDMQLDKVTLSPTFSLTYVHQMTDDYAESGAGTANLTVEDMQTDSLQSLLGVHASMPVMLGNLALTPEAWIGWKYEWLDRDVDINSAFSANVTSPFTTTSEGTSRSQLVAGAAVFSQINETTSLKLNYELNTASDVTIHSVWAMIELNF